MVPMRHLARFLIALSTPACVQIGTDPSTGSGASAVPASLGAGATTAAAAGGTNCVQDPTTHATLCEQMSACPGVDVDQGAFPNCGFRVGSAAPLDLECVCDTSLCPVGVPTTCAQAQALLQGQSALTVCEQLAEGRCVNLAAPDAGSSSCDPACRDECVGAPGCIQLCGC